MYMLPKLEFYDRNMVMVTLHLPSTGCIEYHSNININQANIMKPGVAHGVTKNFTQISVGKKIIFKLSIIMLLLITKWTSPS